MKNTEMDTDNMQDRVAPVATTNNETADCIATVEDANTKEDDMKVNSENSETRKVRCEVETGFFETGTINQKDTPDVLKPLTYIDTATAETRIVPLPGSTPEMESSCRSFILNGSGSISFEGVKIEVFISNIDFDSLRIYICKDGLLIMQYLYTDSDEMSDKNWESVLQTLPNAKFLTKPSAPWLAVDTAPDLYSDWFPFDYILLLVKAWRKIRRSEMTKLIRRLSDFKTTFLKSFDREIDHYQQQNIKLAKQVKMFKATNAELTKQLQPPIHLQQEIEQLRKDVSDKDKQIQTLETTNSGLLAGIQQSVDAQVSAIRKKDEALEYRILELEDERDNLKKSDEKKEKMLKYAQQVLRKHGLSFEMILAS
jgi:hypothetical protein